MANFAVDRNTPAGDLISSINYALTNLGGTTANVLVANADGSIVNNTTGGIVSWQYRYILIRYATNATGSQNFSIAPTNETYYGIQNSSSSNPSTANNSASYSWTQVSGGFGTSRVLWYSTVGGYQIKFAISATTPGAGWQQVPNGQAIDLTVITAVSGNPGPAGSTASVNPATVIYQQQSGGIWTANSTPIIATFSNGSVTSTATINAVISNTGVLSYTTAAIDPTITFTPVTVSNTQIQFSFYQTTSNITVSASEIAIPFVSNSISNYTFNAWALSTQQPATALTNTGSWNFATATGTAPLDPNWTQGNISYIKPSTITVTNNDTANVQVLSNLIVSSAGNIQYYTVYTNNYNFGPNTVLVGGGPYGPPLGAYITPFTVTGNTAYVDLLMVGSGGDGSNGAGVPSYLGEDAGGSGGNVVIASNVALSPGNYVIQHGRGVDTAILTDAYSILERAFQGNTGIRNGNGNIVAGSGAGVNGAAVNPGTNYPAPHTDQVGYYWGGAGVADPWNQITWAGQIAGNGVAYFGGGGSAGSPARGRPTGPYSAAALGGLGGGGNGSTPISNSADLPPTNANIGTGGGGGGGVSTNPSIGYGFNSYGSPGIVVIRQHTSQAPVVNWSLSQPTANIYAGVYQTTTVATTPPGNPSANVTTLNWSTPILISAPVPPSLTITYPQGQLITNNQGQFTPNAVANVVTLTANVQATRANTILAAVTQTTRYFTNNSQFVISSNTSSAYNANALTISTPTISQYAVYQTISYADVGGTATNFISETLQVTTQGNVGPRGFVPLAYIIANTDPTTANTSVLNAMFSAPRTNTTAPIGVGYAPIALDTAQFYFANLAYFNSSVTNVLEYDGTNWTQVTGNVISGDLIVTGTITTAQLNANDVFVLDLASTNAYNQVGNVNSLGFWLNSVNGDAHFAGNTTIGGNLSISNLYSGGQLSANTVGITQISNGSITTGKLAANLIIASNIASTNATFNNLLSSGYWLNGTTGDARFGGNFNIGDNLTVGNNAKIGGNLNVTGLITAGNLQANTVNTTQIIANAVTGNSIAYNTITYNNLGPSVTGLLPSNPGNITAKSSVTLTNGSSSGYDGYIAGTGWICTIGYVGLATQQHQYYNRYLSGNFVCNINFSAGSSTPNYPYLVWYVNGATTGGNTPYLNGSSSTASQDISLFAQTSSTGFYCIQTAISIPASQWNVSTQPYVYLGVAVVMPDSGGSPLGNMSLTNITFSPVLGFGNG